MIVRNSMVTVWLTGSGVFLVEATAVLITISCMQVLPRWCSSLTKQQHSCVFSENSAHDDDGVYTMGENMQFLS